MTNIAKQTPLVDRELLSGSQLQSIFEATRIRITTLPTLPTFERNLTVVTNDIAVYGQTMKGIEKPHVPWITKGLAAKLERIVRSDNYLEDRWVLHIAAAYYELCETLLKYFPDKEITPYKNYSSNIRSLAKENERFSQMLDDIDDEVVLRTTLWEWTSALDKKTEEFQEIAKYIDTQKSTLNFVILNQAFAHMRGQKKDDLKIANYIKLTFGVLMCLPLIGQFIWSQYRDIGFSLNLLVTAIPTVSLTLILLYFFRISLRSSESIKSQLLQLELREALCQFVQGYADYAGPIQDKHPTMLGKFESIVFSSIVGTEDKIPSTFDGMDQIANLIKAVQGKG